MKIKVSGQPSYDFISFIMFCTFLIFMTIIVTVGNVIVIGQEHECQLSRDIVDLIDREVDLMTRGLKAASLEGLRKRISTLFLQYIKTPAFNPEVAKLLRVSNTSCCLKLCVLSTHQYKWDRNISTYSKIYLRFPRVPPS